MHFRTVLELGGRTATGFEVPPEVVAALGSGKRPAVRVTLAGFAYRSTVASMGGRFMIPVSAERRARAGVAAGDEVEVELELDTEPREVTVPPDLAEALAGAPEAEARYRELSVTRRRELVRGIEEAVRPETRLRRVATAVARLRAGSAQR